MANLPLIEPNQAMLNQVPGSAARAVSPNQVQRVGLKAAAQYEGTVAEVLDRLSQTLGTFNRKFAEEAGYQYVADNALTPEQLQAIAKGDVSKVVATGPSINIQQNVIRKARALEIAGHAEIEAKKVVIDMLPDIESGKVGTKDVQAKLATITDGYSRALTAVDPEASLKFRASLGALGNTVIEKAASAELKRRKAENAIKLEIGFQNVERELEEVFGRTQWGIDKNGTQITPNQLTDALRDGFIGQAMLIGGQDVALSYVQKWPKVVQNAKVNALTKHITTDEAMMADPLATYNALRTGQAGALTNVYQSLDQDSKAKVMANLMKVISDRASLTESARAEDKLNREVKANDLFIEFFNSKTLIDRRKQIGIELANLRVLSVDQIERFLNAKVDGDPYAYADLETAIVTGRITDSSDLRKLAARAGMNGEQYAKLNTKLLSGYTKDETSAFKIFRNAAGLPDVIGVRTKDDHHMFDKERIFKERYEIAKRDKISRGEAFDPSALAYEVVDNYNKIDGANVKKNQAQKELDNAVKDIRTRKNMPNSFTIDATTNLDDLLTRKIIDNDQYDFLKKRQRILREVTQ